MRQFVKLNDENSTNRRLVTNLKEEKESLEQRLVNLSERSGNAEYTKRIDELEEQKRRMEEEKEMLTDEINGLKDNMTGLKEKFSKNKRDLQDKKNLMQQEVIRAHEQLVEFRKKLFISDILQGKVDDLEGLLTNERNLVTKLKSNLKEEHDSTVKYSFGNAQNLKMVTSLREENKCLKKTVFELNEKKTVFKTSFYLLRQE